MAQNPPSVELFETRAVVYGERGESLTAEGSPTFAEEYAKTYARILGVPLIDRREKKK